MYIPFFTKIFAIHMNTGAYPPYSPLLPDVRESTQLVFCKEN